MNAPETVDRRRTNNLALIALVVTLMANICALVWGAATLSASVGELNRTVTSQGILTNTLTEKVGRIDTRLGIVEDRSLRNADVIRR